MTWRYGSCDQLVVPQGWEHLAMGPPAYVDEDLPRGGCER